MKRSLSLFLPCACGLLAAVLSFPAARAAPDPGLADGVFAEADAICRRDGGAMWGVSLCGPVLLVDHTDRRVVANAADAGGVLVRDGTRYTGVLPADVIIANTPTEWSGVRWTQLLAMVPDDPAQRRVLIAHELFHRVQPSLGLARNETDNGHLDTLEGRYLLQLEWRALARALQATGPARATGAATEPAETAAMGDDRLAAIADAIAFRRERYARFPQAAANEAALETNEGIPEYTGVKLGLETPAERSAYALHNLRAFVDAPSFVRSFAYAHAPAWGLLLDEVAPGWHRGAATGPRFDDLAEARLDLAAHGNEPFAARARRYDEDGSLRSAEVTRERERQARLAAWREKLLDGPVLVLPMDKANLRFNPQTLVPLPDVGTIYPTLQLVDRWGRLDVEAGGALLRREPRQATVPAGGLSPGAREGEGWKLTLAPGWKLQPGPRTGDWTVACDTCRVGD